MDTMLQQTIDQYSNLALMRGCTAVLPIRFSLVPDTTTGVEYILVASYSEPTFSEVPYNVLWLDLSSGSTSYKQILRRVSHISDGMHRGAWVVLENYADLYAVEQVYQFVVENPSDLGLDPSALQIPLATDTTIGIVKMEEDGSNVAVSSDDPRMSDAREPLPHEDMHPDFARTKIKINQSQYAYVESPAPSVGSTLVLKAQTTDPNVFEAEWRQLTTSDVTWTSEQLDSMIIRVPGSASFMYAGSSMDLICAAVYSGREVVNPAGAHWTIENNLLGITIDPVTGVVTSPALGYDTDIKVSVELYDAVFQKRVSNTYTLRVVVPVIRTLTGIEIIGPDRYTFTKTANISPQHGTYAVNAIWSTGEHEAIIPDSFIAQDDSIPNFVLSGLNLTVSVGIEGDTYIAPDSVQLKAVYQGQEATMTVSLILNEATFAGITAVPSTVAYGDPAHRYDPASANPFSVFVLADTASLNSGLAGMKLLDGTSASEPLITSTEYSIDGHTVVMTAGVTGEADIGSTTAKLYKVPASNYTDAVLTTILTPSATALALLPSFSASTQSAILAKLIKLVKASANPCLFYLQSVGPILSTSNPHPVSITANVGSTKYSAVANYNLQVSKVATSVAVTGPANVLENTSAQLTVELRYADGTVRPWKAGDTKLWSTDGAVAGTTVDTANKVHAGPVNADTNTVLSLQVNTVEGLVLNTTYTIKVTDTVLLPVSAEIVGSQTLNESRPTTSTTKNTYTARVKMSDGSYVTTGFTVNWTAVKASGGVGAITTSSPAASSFDVSVGSGTANGVVTVGATVKYGSSTFTPTLALNVIDTGKVAGIAIVGASQITEGGQATYTLALTYDDGTPVGTVTSFTLTPSSTAAVSVAGQTVTAKSVTADTNLTLSVSYSIESRIFTASLPITIKNVPVALSAIAILGSASVGEGQTATYTCQATYSDGSFTNVTPSWGISASPPAGTTFTNGKLSAGQVSGTTNVTLNASYSEGGVVKTATKVVSITDVAVARSIKFGVVDKINVDSGFNSAFLAALTLPVTTIKADGGVSSAGEFHVAVPASSTTDANGKFAYVAMPVEELGYGYFRTVEGSGYGFAGSWDGAHEYTIPPNDSTWDFAGGILMVIDGQNWYIYRNDFPFNDNPYTFSIVAHASSAISGLA